MRFNVLLATLALSSVSAQQTDVDKQFEGKAMQQTLKKLAKDPFAQDVKQRKLVSNGAQKPRKPRPFRFPERKPKMTIKQVTRPNYHVTPTFVVPPPVHYHAHPYYHHPGYAYHYHPETVKSVPLYPGYPRAAPTSGPVELTKSKTTDSLGRPQYPEWAREILGTYRPHDVHVHHPFGVAHAHPYYGYPMKFPVPSYKDFMNDKYYDSLKSAADKARYHYAFDACQRRGKKWSANRRYKCFKLMWKQYKPHKSNSINAVRDRVQKDCSKFDDQPEQRKKCFQDHIKNYEDRLLHKKKKIASGLAEAEDANADEENDLDESNNDYEKKVQALNEDADDEGEDDDDSLIGDNDEELNTESLQDAEQEAKNDVEEYGDDE